MHFAGVATGQRQPVRDTTKELMDLLAKQIETLMRS